MKNRTSRLALVPAPAALQTAIGGFALAIALLVNSVVFAQTQVASTVKAEFVLEVRKARRAFQPDEVILVFRLTNLADFSQNIQLNGAAYTDDTDNVCDRIYWRTKISGLEKDYNLEPNETIQFGLTDIRCNGKDFSNTGSVSLSLIVNYATGVKEVAFQIFDVDFEK